MEANVWDSEAPSSTEGITVVIGGETEQVSAPLTADSLKEMANDAGIKKFSVSVNGVTATSGNFPVTSGTVVVTEYNEAK